MFALKIIDIVDVGIKAQVQVRWRFKLLNLCVYLSIKSSSNKWTQTSIDSSTAVEN